MRTTKHNVGSFLTRALLPLLVLGLVHCGADDKGGNGAAGAPNEGGAANNAGSGENPTAGKPGIAGASGSSGAPGAAGASGSGAAGASGGSGAAGTSGGGASGGSGAAGASGASAGAGAGGASAGDAGAGGAGAGGAGAGGVSGAGAGGAGGSGGVPSLSGLPTPPGAANVAKPSGTASSVTVVSWAGFKGALSFTFDDTNQSQIDYYDDMNAIGLKYTYYLQTNKTTELNSPVWPKAVLAGHELGNHTKSHQSTDTGGVDTDAAQATIESKFNVKVYTMAAPNGSTSYGPIAATRYLINRGVSAGTIMPKDASDPFNLPCYLPAAGTGQNYATYLGHAKAGGWDVILVHGFTKKPNGIDNETDGAYNAVEYTKFKTDALQAAKSATDIWTDTVVKVGAYWRAEKLFASLTPTTSGSDKIWTWTLPAHFPPNQYLRVKVDGGTLKQNGTPLTWDAHGYYEISLDSNSVTLSP